jgi:Methyltransferase domain
MNDPPNFNRLARLYRWMEWLSFGPWLALTRTAFLPEAAHGRRALVIGDGDGRFTDRLLRSNPAIHVDAVDTSSAMLDELLRRAGPKASRVRVHLADARTWQPPAPILAEPYDLIATHFFLDCLTQHEVRALAAKIGSAAAPSALWVVSEFAVPEGRFGALIARRLVSGLYWAFSWLTGLTVRALPDHGAALRSAGFTQIERRARLGGLLISELWSTRYASLLPEETDRPVCAL